MKRKNMKTNRWKIDTIDIQEKRIYSILLGKSYARQKTNFWSFCCCYYCLFPLKIFFFFPESAPAQPLAEVWWSQAPTCSCHCPAERTPLPTAPEPWWVGFCFCFPHLCSPQAGLCVPGASLFVFNEFTYALTIWPMKGCQNFGSMTFVPWCYTPECYLTRHKELCRYN